MRLNSPSAIGLTLIAFGLALTACNPGTGVRHTRPDSATGPLRLVAYDSCDTAVKSLKAAARTTTSQYRAILRPAARPGAGLAEAGATRSAAGAAPNTVTSAPDYSDTNVHEPGVDEPDIVKTDGSRIVTVTSNSLRTVDATSRRLPGELLMPLHSGAPAELLLHGDRALVLFPSTRIPIRAAWADQQPYTSDVVLVDLSGRGPRLAGTLTVDGSLIDARQVGSAARVVVRSTPGSTPSIRQRSTPHRSRTGCPASASASMDGP